MKLLKFYIFVFCLLSSVMSYADSFKSSTDTDGNIFYTYTRTDVAAGSWQSFCLPMNVDINTLQKYFDKIYVAYNGEELDFYNVLDPNNSFAKRKVTSSTSRYCFAYSATESNYYHYFMADFTSESEKILPQGMPFFGHVKQTFTDGMLTISGHLWSGEEALTDDIVEKSFNVYSDQSLQTIDSDKSFTVIGSLSENGTYSGNLFTLSGDGSTTTTASSLQQYHAYLVGKEAEGVLIYAETVADLLALTEINVTDPSDNTLDLTDDNSTLLVGTYKAGNISYTRTVNNYYAGFYVPFDVNLSTMADNFQDVYVLSGFAIYNPSTYILTTFYKKFTDTTLPAYTPFLAVMTTDEDGAKMSQNVCLKSSSTTTITSTADKDPVAMKVYDYDFQQGSIAKTSTNYTVSFGGTLNAADHAKSEGYNIPNGKDGSWGYVNGTLKAYREFVIVNSLTSLSKEATIEMSFEDTPSAITNVVTVSPSNESIYDLSGRKLNNNQPLHHGIYIKDGKKIIVKYN